jgi:Mg2+-importing ATPase
VLVANEGRHYTISKGAFEQILAVCVQVELSDEKVKPLAEVKQQINDFYVAQSQLGFRVLGVAYKEIPASKPIDKDDEQGMTLLGFLLFNDPAKAGSKEAIERLSRLGISFKMITGDNQHTARYVWQEIGLPSPRVVTGTELRQVTARALPIRAQNTDIFAEVEPDQKERLILALKRAGHVVGYLGDGVNDSPALHMADVGISVNSAVDVAKEAASFVLLEKDLNVLATGVVEGRRTFANTLKYVFMATSANFGNMFSMAGASLIMPFLPLLPTQILLTNLLTDVPETTIATDLVDAELVDRPRRWDIGFIRKFMLTFGLLSSIFDYLTFGVLFWGLHASVEQFRTGWFLESVISASIIVLVIRTRHPFYKSRIGKYLVISTALVGAAVLLLPYSPLARLFQFTPLPPIFMASLLVIVILYIIGAELVKKQFYRLVKY